MSANTVCMVATNTVRMAGTNTVYLTCESVSHGLAEAAVAWYDDELVP